jgi:hypothetical protein
VFIGGLICDEGSIGGDVSFVPTARGEAWNPTPRLKVSAS